MSQGGAEPALPTDLYADLPELIAKGDGVVVGPEGGRVVFQDGLELDVPAGALSEPTEIHGHVASTPASLTLFGAAAAPAVELLPEGLVFRLPARLVTDRPALGVAELYMIATPADESSTEDIAIAELANAKLAATIWHFTTFTLFSRANLADKRVSDVAAAACGSTAGVVGLSREILEVLTGSLGARLEPNLVVASSDPLGAPLLQPSVAQALSSAVADAAPPIATPPLQVTSGWRSLAQQYVLANCVSPTGGNAVAKPGTSNHADGSAFDLVGPYPTSGACRAANCEGAGASLDCSSLDADALLELAHPYWGALLERDAYGFTWFGSNKSDAAICGDPPHFDKPGASDFKPLAIRAFQVLWNRRHPCDRIQESGIYDADTDVRLASAPAAGFGSTDALNPPPQGLNSDKVDDCAQAQLCCPADQLHPAPHCAADCACASANCAGIGGASAGGASAGGASAGGVSAGGAQSSAGTGPIEPGTSGSASGGATLGGAATGGNTSSGGNASAGTGGGAPLQCSRGLYACTDSDTDQQSCVDLVNDARHCGSCDNPCAAGEHCTQGICCSALDVACYDSAARAQECVNLSSDDQHCGACLSVCDADKDCVNRICVCSPGLTTCGTACVDIKTNAQNCGGCNQPCQRGQSCVDGVCQCASPNTTCTICKGATCSTTCNDTSTDKFNCGVCGHICPGNQVCDGGECGCPQGETLCNNFCFDLQKSAEHCLTCDHACAYSQICQGGECVCAPGQIVCNGVCVDPNTDPTNCGGCGIKCDDLPANTCSGATLTTYGPGVCQSRSCKYPPKDSLCPDTSVCSGNSCVCVGEKTLCGTRCVDTSTDTSNCGKCYRSCQRPSDTCDPTYKVLTQYPVDGVEKCEAGDCSFPSKVRNCGAELPQGACVSAPTSGCVSCTNLALCFGGPGSGSAPSGSSYPIATFTVDGVAYARDTGTFWNWCPYNDTVTDSFCGVHSLVVSADSGSTGADSTIGFPVTLRNNLIYTNPGYTYYAHPHWYDSTGVEVGGVTFDAPGEQELTLVIQ